MCSVALCASLHKLSFTFSSDTLDKDDRNTIQIEDPSITAGCWIFSLRLVSLAFPSVHESSSGLPRLAALARVVRILPLGLRPVVPLLGGLGHPASLGALVGCLGSLSVGPGHLIQLGVRPSPG